MRRKLIWSIFFLTLVFTLVGGSLVAATLARASQNQRAILRGQNVPLISHASLLGTANSAQILNLSIGLLPRDPAGLDNFLQAVYTPDSPQYHQYLTPEEFNQLFAPTDEQVQEVTSFLKAQNLTVNSIASNHLLIDASGTVNQVQQAFQVKINTYKYNDRTFYSNAQSPSIPSSLQSLIISVSGLDNSVQYQPHYQHTNGTPVAHVNQKADISGYGPDQLSSAYDTLPFTDANIQGENQTVALFELDGYQLPDIQQYYQNYGLGTPNISNVLVDQASGSAGAGAIEVELDIEVIGAIAPNAHQTIYEGPNSTQGLNDTYNRIVTDNKAQIISTSWGLCESSTGSAELKTLDTIFKEAAAQGISLYAAAGDSGAYDCGNTMLSVDSPADDPYVTGVGGTNLQIDENNNYISETPWSDTSNIQRGPKGSGGGGGISNTFVRPSWQTGTGTTSSYSSGKPCNAPTGQYCREVPDISADADPATGYSIYCTVSNAGCPSTGWFTVGGTSAAAPFWAASTTLINQYLKNQNLAVLGTANPALYSIFNSSQPAPAFHDITSGNNLYYPGAPGYDMATGIGSPDVSNLAKDLAAKAKGGTPAPLPTPPPSTTTQLLKNTGFEGGQKPWMETSSGGYELIDNQNPHKGQNSAYLCGYTGCNDSISQIFSVPTAIHTLSLGYWWYSDTMKTSSQCLDTFVVTLITATGQTIKTLQHNCNSDATNKWQQQNLDLSSLLTPYRGQQVTLTFQGTTQANQFQSTDFYVDDVTLNAS